MVSPISVRLLPCSSLYFLFSAYLWCAPSILHIRLDRPNFFFLYVAFPVFLVIFSDSP